MKRLVLLLLSAALLAGSALAADFSDVGQGDWYAVPVAEMAGRGVLTGYPDGTFRPTASITAAELVAEAARQAGLPKAASDDRHWAAGYLTAALQAGWYDWDELPPTGEGWNQPISRKLAIKVVMRALLPDARGEYGDWAGRIADFAQLPGRYYESTFAAYQAGVVKGDDQGCFLPDSPLSRAEACALIYRAGRAAGAPPPASADPAPDPEAQPPQAAVTLAGGATEHGWLRVEGTRLCDEAGEPVVLRGMSTHGLQWYGQFASKGAIASTAAYGANVFRVAMYTGEGGYLSNAALADQAFAAVDAAIENDMYVILDWHILSDGNPRSSQAKAEEFFTRAARRYAGAPNVLYEVCNEPNGAVSWSGDVKPYAQAVIAAIRAESPKAVVLVGSPTWSQDLHLAAADPLSEENVMYTCHFYAGTHGQYLRERIAAAQTAGLAVFVSEWGTSRADGSGGVFLEESAQWLDFLEERGISWCNWSLCDKGETSAALTPGAAADGPWGEGDLTRSGAFVFGRFR